MTLQKQAKTALTDLLERWVDTQIKQRPGETPILMLSGAQGIGKTFALSHLLRSTGRLIAVIGLDDVYHTRAARQRLAQSIHPLCDTRGPPGTHDLALLERTLDALLTAQNGDETPLPRFDKPSDERLPNAQWPCFQGRPEAIIIEGWMMGAHAKKSAAHAMPINALEARDPQGIWRSWQETALKDSYEPLWRAADSFIHLCAPDFSAVLAWRLQQEESNFGLSPGTLPEEKRAWVSTFIQHFERITRRMLAGERAAGHAVELDASRRILNAAQALLTTA